MVSDMPCGIDVESVGRYRDSVARYSMDEEQMQHILSSDNPALTFIRLWTQKEAYLKALGTGIQDNMRDIPSSLLRRVTHTEVHSDKGYALSWCVLENAHKPH
jgi:4'-phosphopantetheinyl transferase